MPLDTKSAPIGITPPGTAPELRQFLESARNALLLLTGQSGNLRKTAVLYEDLRDLGIITLRSARGGTSYTALPGESTSSEEEDLSPPPTPTSLMLTATINQIIVEFGGFTIPTDNVASTEIYRGTVNDLDYAVLIGTADSYMFVDHTVVDDTTYYYWVRNVSPAGVYSPYNSLIGTSISLDATPDAVVDLLVQQINQQQEDPYSTSILTVESSIFAIENSSETGVEYPFIIETVDGITKIALNGTSFIPDASIGTAAIDNLAVDTARIVDLAITEGKIRAGTIQSAKIGTAAVTTAKIKDLEVRTINLAGQSVTFPVAYSNPVRTPPYANIPFLDRFYTYNVYSRPAIYASLFNNSHLYAIGTARGDGMYHGDWIELFTVPYNCVLAEGNLVIDYSAGQAFMYELAVPSTAPIYIELQVLQDSTEVYTKNFLPLQNRTNYLQGGYTWWTLLSSRTALGIARLARNNLAASSYLLQPGWEKFPEVIYVDSPRVSSNITVRYRFVHQTVITAANTALLPTYAIGEVNSTYSCPYVLITQVKR